MPYGIYTDFDKIKFLNGVFEFAQKDIVSGGSKRNLNYISEKINFHENLANFQKIMLADAQTSGGLLISLPHQKANELITRLEQKKIRASVVGEVFEPQGSPIQVVQ